MQLQANQASNRFPKFQNIGDKVSGKFISMDPARSTPFGPKCWIELESSELGRQEITCPAGLAKILVDNRKHLQPGTIVTITYVESVPTNKGNPFKRFTVDVEAASANIRPTTVANEYLKEDDMPF
jgi:hypothetical protein